MIALVRYCNGPRSASTVEFTMGCAHRQRSAISTQFLSGRIKAGGRVYRQRGRRMRRRRRRGVESEENGGRAKFRDCVFMRYKELCIRVTLPIGISRNRLAGKAEICWNLWRIGQVVCARTTTVNSNGSVSDFSRCYVILLTRTYIYWMFSGIFKFRWGGFVVNTIKTQQKYNYTLPRRTCNIFYVR